MKTWYQLRMYWKHLFLARHRRGHGVHSPFVYDLITKVIEEKCPYYCYDDIEDNQSFDDKKCQSAGAAQLMFRLLHYWCPDQWQTWLSEADKRTAAYLQVLRSAARPQGARGGPQLRELAIRFQAIQSSTSRLALLLDLSDFKADDVSGLYSQVAACLQEARQQHQAVMLILLHPHTRKYQRRLWRKMRQDLHCPVVLDAYDLALMIEAEGLGTFQSKVVYA